jgi:acyl-CoA synthetase (AMP-forming)/AMP-acid ligase II
MFTLVESAVNDDLSRLAEAWSRPETFVFVPDKSGIAADWLSRALAQIPAEFGSHHFALLTSGSTGLPKLILGARARSERLVEVLHRLQASAPVRETILALPLSYSYAFVNQWLWATRHERRLVPTRGFGQPELLRSALENAEEAMICLVGVQVPLLTLNFEGKSFPGVIRVHFAGGRFPQEKLDIVRCFFPHAQIFNNYGCAEAMPRLTIRRAEDGEQASDIGRPLPGIELKTAESGDLTFRSAYGAVGFVDENGFSRISPEMWVRTGDLGQQMANSAWQLLGRAAEVFKRHGEKVSLPALLSTVHQSWPGQAAFYREADHVGEEGHVLVLSPHGKEDQVRAILKAFRTNHPRAHWPLRVESLAALPLLPNGKVDIRRLASLEGRVVHWYQRI